MKIKKGYLIELLIPSEGFVMSSCDCKMAACKFSYVLEGKLVLGMVNCGKLRDQGYKVELCISNLHSQTKVFGMKRFHCK